jgi:hypothetical protein
MFKAFSCKAILRVVNNCFPAGFTPRASIVSYNGSITPSHVKAFHLMFTKLAVDTLCQEAGLYTQMIQAVNLYQDTTLLSKIDVSMCTAKCAVEIVDKGRPIALARCLHCSKGCADRRWLPNSSCRPAPHSAVRLRKSGYQLCSAEWILGVCATA